MAIPRFFNENFVINPKKMTQEFVEGRLGCERLVWDIRRTPDSLISQITC